MPERNGKQCRERWVNHLGPRLRKGSWDDEEKETLDVVKGTKALQGPFNVYPTGAGGAGRQPAG